MKSLFVNRMVNQVMEQFINRIINRINLLAIMVLLLTSTFITAKDDDQNARADYIRANYAKYEYQIKMRDGVKLFTTVYVPYKTAEKYPILLHRTPYRVSPYGLSHYAKSLGPEEGFEKEGFIFAYQDVRGKFMSEGEFVNMRPQNAHLDKQVKADDATDTYDTIDFLVKNIPNNNGKVGMWGTSYPGYYTSVGAINSHKALKAISPQAPIADWYFDDFHRNGAFVLPMAFIFFDFFDKQRTSLHSDWPERMKQETPDGYDFFHQLGPLSNVNEKYFKGERPFWNDLVEHPDYDEYWQARNILPHLKNIKPATLVVGGWYDTEDLYGPLATYQTMSNNNRHDHIKIVMGPWYHGQWNRSDGDKLGEANFGFDTSKWYQSNIQLPFFKHHLKGTKDPRLATATMFETGANRWRKFDSWPPKNLIQQRWYFQPQASINKIKPELKSAYSEYVSDPNKPVPHSAEIGRGWDKPYMVEDQRFTARRTDVLTFNSDVQQQDLTIAGEIEFDLWVSTSQTDADFIVKLIDVFPGKNADTNKMDKETGNRHELVRWGVIRGRYRNSMSQPEPFESNQPTQVKLVLYDVLHTIKRGHKLQVQIQSSFFPFLDRNPQKYVTNIFKAKAEDFVKAEHRIYHSAELPSSMTIKTLTQ
ncbi:CocE/NonD family hydrolase [Aliikangiella maris]|uniref:CocE/NonD family hydrolase n=2 Tax=Aliikangiella maris TaxID=3162458 RepID=A0ABV3MUB0_9GAMM